MPEKLRVLDLFSGIQSADSALDSSEPDSPQSLSARSIKYASAVLRKHWPDVPCYDDVRTVTAARLRADGIIRELAPNEKTGYGPTPTGDTSLRRGKYAQGGKSLGNSVLMSSAGDSPARTSATPERAQGLPGKGRDYGQKSPVWLASYDPATSSWRTSQHCLVEGLTVYSETWPRSGMTRNGTAYQLQPLVRLTDATESGLLATQTAKANQLSPSMEKHPGCRNWWPTPDTMRGITRAAAEKEVARGAMSLRVAVHVWPTPGAADNRDRGNLSMPSIQRRQRLGKQLNLGMVVDPNSGALNPTWVEWLMGFPPEWTALDASEMPSSRPLSKSLAKRSSKQKSNDASSRKSQKSSVEQS
jgi:hypothetical protein